MESENKISVLMVCLGNICRSPMAEAVFTHVASTHNLLPRFSKIDSAGTAGYHVGSNPDSRSVAVCKSNGVPVSHKARKVKKDDFYEFDYILAMDRSNLYDLNQAKPKDGRAKVMMFGEFEEEGRREGGGGVELEDPYYGGEEGFEVNFGQCWRCSVGFLREVLKADV